MNILIHGAADDFDARKMADLALKHAADYADRRARSPIGWGVDAPDGERFYYTQWTVGGSVSVARKEDE